MRNNRFGAALRQLLLISIVLFSWFSSKAQTITTVAGQGGFGYNGDGMAATAAALLYPWQAAVDGGGNMYIADFGNNRIRKISSAGIISTVAGNGTTGFTGDGGPATNASIGSVYCVAFDTSGNLLMGVSGAIRFVDRAGIITTIAGNGTAGFAGDGGAATAASIAGASNIVVDRLGNIYFTDKGNHRIRKIGRYGTITTIAGTGTAGFSGDGGAATSANLHWPSGLAINSAGELFFCDEYNCRVRKITASGIISTVAGSGATTFSGDGYAATDAGLYRPVGVCLDNAGNLYISTKGYNRVRKVNTSGMISTFAGNGGDGYNGDGIAATAASLTDLFGVMADTAGNIFVCEGATTSRVRKIDASGTISTVAGFGHPGYSGDGGSATLAQLQGPLGVCVDPGGNMYITDNLNSRVRKVTPAGVISTFAGDGTRASYGDGGPATAAALDNVDCVQSDRKGNIYISEWDNMRIRKVDTSGIITAFAGGGSSSADGVSATTAAINNVASMVFDSFGNLYFADTYNSKVRKIDTFGIVTTVAGNGTTGYTADSAVATAAAFDLINGVYVDARGVIYLTEGSRIRMVTSTGILLTLAGTGSSGYSGDGGPATAAEIGLPYAITGDNQGNIYFTDLFNFVVRRVDSNGIISTFAGVGYQGFSGDSGPASAAALGFAESIFADATGNIFIGDRDNNNIRVVRNCARAGSISGLAAICVGDTATLHDPSTLGIWSASDTTVATVSSSVGAVRGMARGTTIVRYTIVNACGADTATHTITVGAPPVVGTISGRDSICIGDTTTLRDTTAMGVWGTNNAAVASISTMGVVTATAGGSATLWYTASNSCGADTAFHSIWVKSITECTTGFRVLAGNTTTNLSIFPNPTTGTFTLRLTTPVDEDATVTITNVLRQKVWTQAFTSNRDVAVNFDVAAGTYLVRVTGKNGTSAVTHVVKE